jgi:hypothetical protein
MLPDNVGFVSRTAELFVLVADLSISSTGSLDSPPALHHIHPRRGHANIVLLLSRSRSLTSFSGTK